MSFNEIIRTEEVSLKNAILLEGLPGVGNVGKFVAMDVLERVTILGNLLSSNVEKMTKNEAEKYRKFLNSLELFDTINFDLFIKDQKNNDINTEDLSAGERQLLAVSILWGLAQA